MTACGGRTSAATEAASRTTRRARTDTSVSTRWRPGRAATTARIPPIERRARAARSATLRRPRRSRRSRRLFYSGADSVVHGGDTHLVLGSDRGLVLARLGPLVGHAARPPPTRAAATTRISCRTCSRHGDASQLRREGRLDRLLLHRPTPECRHQGHRASSPSRAVGRARTTAAATSCCACSRSTHTVSCGSPAHARLLRPDRSPGPRSPAYRAS